MLTTSGVYFSERSSKNNSGCFCTSGPFISGSGSGVLLEQGNLLGGIVNWSAAA